jgi:hypothetical protein
MGIDELVLDHLIRKGVLQEVEVASWDFDLYDLVDGKGVDPPLDSQTKLFRINTEKLS